MPKINGTKALPNTGDSGQQYAQNQYSYNQQNKSEYKKNTGQDEKGFQAEQGFLAAVGHINQSDTAHHASSGDANKNKVRGNK